MITVALKKLILASGSPRRQKILKDMGYDCDVVVSGADENMIENETPEDHVTRVSGLKAESVAKDYPGDLVLGADTIVVLGSAVLGKPGSRQEAIEMLERLSSKTHTVYTGLTMICIDSNFNLSGFDSTKVTFNKLNRSEIERYVDTGEPMDKAGAYGIQGMGAFLVERYEGALDTVIGFPGALFERMYQEASQCQ